MYLNDYWTSEYRTHGKTGHSDSTHIVNIEQCSLSTLHALKGLFAMHNEDWENDPFGVSDPVMMNVFDEYQYYAKGIKWKICR